MAAVTPRFGDDPLLGAKPLAPLLSVRAVSEHVFCPRAAVLTLESADKDEEPQLGPRLGAFFDYDEQRFAAAVEQLGGKLRFWLTVLAPSLLLVYVVWQSASLPWVVAATLPACLSLAAIWDTLRELIVTVRERRGFDRAPVLDFNDPPTRVTEVNWWSLRKSGFDCLKPESTYEDQTLRVCGKPWRVLTKDTVIRIPVVRKHRGNEQWGPQHRVRLAGYAQLIENFEGATAPFGLLMFRGSYDCVLIPLDGAALAEFRRAVDDTRESLRIDESRTSMLAPPKDGRCSGCGHGAPTRELPPPRRDGSPPPVPIWTRASNSSCDDDDGYRSACGDRFRWVPPHEEAKRRGLTS